jgi:hypothetical protein
MQARCSGVLATQECRSGSAVSRCVVARKTCAALRASGHCHVAEAAPGREVCMVPVSVPAKMKMRQTVRTHVHTHRQRHRSGTSTWGSVVYRTSVQTLIQTPTPILTTTPTTVSTAPGKTTAVPHPTVIVDLPMHMDSYPGKASRATEEEIRWAPSPTREVPAEAEWTETLTPMIMPTEEPDLPVHPSATASAMGVTSGASSVLSSWDSVRWLLVVGALGARLALG